MGRLFIALICLFSGIAQGQEISVFSMNALGDNTNQSGFTCSYSLGDAVTTLAPSLKAGFTNIVSELDPQRNLILKLFLEGLFDSSMLLNLQAHSSSGPVFQEDFADTLSIELHSFTTPPVLLNTLHGVGVPASGLVSLLIPDSLPLKVYLSIKHRNSVETWLAQPINTVTGGYADLTVSASSVYGSNLKNISGFYCIYSGDVNQDGSVDALDLIRIDNQAAQSGQGYINEDLNGDAVVDETDINISKNNVWEFVRIRKP